MLTMDFIRNYIFDNYKGVKDCKVIKKNNKYIGKVVKTNPKFNREDYRRYTNCIEVDMDYLFIVGFGYAFILFTTSLLCAIPHVVGVLLFTVINIILVTFFVRDFNIYDRIIWVVIAVCLFLITIFIIHFVLTDNVLEHSHAKDAINTYKAFHTIYPESLFKFKFK